METMDERAVEPATAIEKYRRRVQELYDNIASWTSLDHGVRLLRSPVEVNDPFGTYELQKLDILITNQVVATVVPVSAVVIAAQGRVEIKGRVDTAAVVYFEASPVYHVTSQNQNGEVTAQEPVSIFEGVEEAGWYWLPYVPSQRVAHIDQETFTSIMREIADVRLTPSG